MLKFGRGTHKLPAILEDNHLICTRGSRPTHSQIVEPLPCIRLRCAARRNTPVDTSYLHFPLLHNTGSAGGPSRGFEQI